MEKEPSSTNPARVELNVPELLDYLIKITSVVIDPSSMGQFAPNSVQNAAETLFMGLIEGINRQLKESDFRAHFVNEFILGTDLYKLTDINKLQKAVKDKQSKIIIAGSSIKH